jgi:hypothetical protein
MSVHGVAIRIRKYVVTCLAQWLAIINWNFALRTSHPLRNQEYAMEEPQGPPSAASGDGDDIMYIKA